MSFTGFSFLLYFLPVVVLGGYLLPQGKTSLRGGFLLLASMVFAFAVQPKCLLVLAVITVLCYLAALWMDACRTRGGKRAVFAAAVILLLALLVNYKVSAASQSGVVVPIGISFVTFTAISYLADCDRGSIRAERSLARLSLYFSFFPKLTQGPITRYGAWDAGKKPDAAALAAGAERFIIGLSKKVLLAAAMAQMADGAFSAHRLGTLAAWLGAAAYAFEIYFDFSGYTDMAIGIGAMLGVRLPENFDHPYTAQSITDFWRRWHISLSRWFRDYLYIPLGGNRRGTARQMCNLLIVWLATGLWHGFTANFVIWGLWFAVLLILEKLFFGKVLEKLPRALRSVYTLAAVVLSWVFFRTGDLPAALRYLGMMFGGGVSENVGFLLRQYGAELVLCAVFSTSLGAKLLQKLEKSGLGRAVKAALLLGLFVLCILERNGASLNAFVYAQF